MTKIRRPILIIGNLLLLLIGGGLLAGGIGIRESSNLVLRHHAPAEEVRSKVYEITDVKKLQAMAAHQYEYLDGLAIIAEWSRDFALFSSVIVLGFTVVNFVLIPWRLTKRESKPADGGSPVP